MEIQYRGKNWGESPFLTKLMELVFTETAYFEVLLDILQAYTTPDNSPDTQKDRQTELQHLIATKDGLISRSKSEIEDFCSMLDYLYELGNGTYGNVRGDLLESISYRVGPNTYKRTDNTQIYYEAQVLSDESVMGGDGDDHNFDFIFTEDENNHPDFFECKANIKNFVSMSVAPEQMRAVSKRRKWIYMKRVYSSLADNSLVRPNVFIPCLNTERELLRIKEYLERHGYGFIKFVSRERLIELVG